MHLHCTEDHSRFPSPTRGLENHKKGNNSQEQADEKQQAKLPKQKSVVVWQHQSDMRCGQQLGFKPVPSLHKNTPAAEWCLSQRMWASLWCPVCPRGVRGTGVRAEQAMWPHAGSCYPLKSYFPSSHQHSHAICFPVLPWCLWWAPEVVVFFFF